LTPSFIARSAPSACRRPAGRHRRLVDEHRDGARDDQPGRVADELRLPAGDAQPLAACSRHAPTRSRERQRERRPGLAAGGRDRQVEDGEIADAVSAATCVAARPSLEAQLAGVGLQAVPAARRIGLEADAGLLEPRRPAVDGDAAAVQRDDRARRHRRRRERRASRRRRAGAP
jgi:hypothetical protein